MPKTRHWKRETAAKARERQRQRRCRRRRVSLANRHVRRLLAEVAAPAKSHDGARRPIPTISPPTALDLEENYLETIQLLQKIRLAADVYSAKFMLDMRLVKSITPAAALLLTAECDRWRMKTGRKKLQALEVGEWEPSVRRRLAEMGFFEVLGATCNVKDQPVVGEDQFVPFLKGTRSPGEPAKTLRSSIESFGPQVVDRSALYDGLVEAMTNVHKHAYKERGNSLWHLWWISASVNLSTNHLTVMVVDHGQGIARTLPRSGLWEDIRELIRARGKNDAALVEAAFNVEGTNRSATGLENRGKGLREDVKGYVDSYVDTHNSSAALHVITNKARYRYERDQLRNTTTSDTLPVEFGGTFIQWDIEDYGHEPDDH